jgi:CRP-like cAMP-binding protein
LNEFKLDYETSEVMPVKRFIRTFHKSEVIFEENSQGNEMYIIYSGKVKLFTNETGKEMVWGTIGKGEFFGEISLVDAAPRDFTATAEDDNTQLIVLDKIKFMYLVQQQPAFALIIMNKISQRARYLLKLYQSLLEETGRGDKSPS